MRALVSTIIALAFLAAAPATRAALCDSCPSIQTPGTLPTFPIEIFSGSRTWFDSARDGEGWTFTEVPRGGGQNPVGLGVVYTYETSGAPTWLLLQGEFAAERDASRILNGSPVSVLTAGAFDGVGGSCPTCPWTTPTIGQRRYMQGQVQFLRPDLATVRLDGQVAGSGEANLVPFEVGATIPMPGLLQGRWRFTVRSVGNLSGSYLERNFPTHGCELEILPVPSPSRDNQFQAAPGQNPFWVPPSGSQVQWHQVSRGITCLNTASVSNPNLYIAYDPASRRNYRAIALASATAVTVVSDTGGFPQPVTVSYDIAEFSRFAEVFVQDANTLIVRFYGNNAPAGPRLDAEYLLTRAP